MRILRVGFTHGDINGIGLEMIAKILSAPEMLEICTPIIFSDSNCFQTTVRTLELEAPVQPEIIRNPADAKDGRINLVNVCKPSPAIEWGQQTEAALQAEASSLNAAIDAFKKKSIDLLVSAPGNLDNDADSHSMSDFVRQALGSDASDFDWVVSERMRTIKLHSVTSLTELGEDFALEALMSDIRKIYNQLREDLSEIRPRMVVLSGNMRLADKIHELQEEGVTVFGPFEAAGFIEAGNLEHYDAVLFLDEENARHQLLKSLNPSLTYGYVSGLPLILTYPLTGISYPIAGKNAADETALRNALYAAIDTFRNREAFAQATYKPLEKQWVPKGRDDYKLDLSKEE